MPPSQSTMNSTVPVMNSTVPSNSSYITTSSSNNDIIISLSVMGALILMANGFVFILVYKNRSLRTKTNFFLVSLAVSDISSGLIGIPLLIACNTFEYGNGEICKAMDICNKFLAISTILHLFSATIERFIKVFAPLHYRRLLTKRRVLLILAGIWLVALTTPLVELVWEDGADITQTYSIIILCCFVIFPFIVMGSMTIHIFYIIRQQKKRLKVLVNRKMAKKQRKRKQVERRAIVVYSAMYISYAMGWFPYFVLSYLDDYLGEYDLPAWLLKAFVLSKYSTALVDPLLYTFFKTDFQAAIRSMVPIRYGNIATRNMHLSTMQTSQDTAPNDPCK